MKKSELKNIFEELVNVVKETKIFKNPTDEDIKKLLKNQIELKSPQPKKVRFIIDFRNKDVYVFSGEKTIHYDVASKIGLKDYNDNLSNNGDVLLYYLPGNATLDGNSMKIERSDVLSFMAIGDKNIKNFTQLANKDYAFAQKYFDTDIKKWVKETLSRRLGK
jgi:hypothetical protein